jgi:hypothetical protein
MMRALQTKSTILQGITSQGQSNMVIWPHKISELLYVSQQDELRWRQNVPPKRHIAHTRFQPVGRTEGANSTSL